MKTHLLLVLFLLTTLTVYAVGKSEVKTLSCNTEIFGIKATEMRTTCACHNGAVFVYIEWDDTADSYELEYGLKGFEKGMGEVLVAERYSEIVIPFEELESYTDYEFYIRAKCDGSFGEWTGVNSFSTTKLHENEKFEVHFDDITHNSAMARWESNYQSDGYQIEYGPKGFELGTGKTLLTINAEHALLELMPDTEYSFFVRRDNLGVEEPAWSVEFSFKTLPCNTEISGIEATEMWTTCECHNGAVAVYIRWNDITDSYELEYGLKGFEKGMGEVLETDGYSDIVIPFEELESYTDYEFYIRAKCSDKFGEWTGVNTFSTTKLHTSIESVQIPNLNIYPNPVENILHIDFDSNYDLANINVTIFDLNGVVQYKFKYQEGYDISSLSAGQYIVSVTDKRLSKTMIIQKK